MLSRPGSVYRSLETDKEFKTRVLEKHPHFTSYYAGPGLDAEVWSCYKMQRKIIERG